MTPDEINELYAHPMARKAVARVLELIRENRDVYLDPAYCSDQPMCSFAERFVLDQQASLIENEFGLGTLEQCELLQKPNPFELCRAAKANNPNPAIAIARGRA